MDALAQNDYPVGPFTITGNKVAMSQQQQQRTPLPTSQPSQGPTVEQGRATLASNAPSPQPQQQMMDRGTPGTDTRPPSSYDQPVETRRRSAGSGLRM